MKKIFLAFPLILILLLGCKNNVVEPYNYEKNTPTWLTAKIDSIAISDRTYDLFTEVYRYKWNNNFTFQFVNGLNSCMFCQVYFYEGTKVNFVNDSTLQNYLQNRTNKFLIWKNPKR
jgi:hypothetical protein